MTYVPAENVTGSWMLRLGERLMDTERSVSRLTRRRGRITIACSSFELAVEILRELDALEAMAREHAAAGKEGSAYPF